MVSPVARPLCPHCGKQMSFQEDRSLPVETLEGCITLKRSYYYCRSCHEGLFPLDQALHLRGCSSEGVQQAAVESGADKQSYKKAAAHFTRLTAVPMSGTTLAALMQEHGGHLVAQEAAAAEQASAPLERDALRRVRRPRCRRSGWLSVRTGPLSIQDHVRTLKTFSSWLYREGHTHENILKRLPMPKVPKLLVEPLTEEEIKKVFASIKTKTKIGARDYAILLLFLDTGIRNAELCTLTVE